MYYHIFCWTGAVLAASSPFWLVPKWQEIYGFWFINPHIDDTANCWIKITWNNYAWPIWVYFFVPLMLIYCVVLLCLVTAYMRLRRGVTRSFLPRLRLLIMNTVNLVVHMLYWAIFVLFYAWTFWTRIQFTSGYFQPTNNIIYFVMGSKGCSCLLVWILTANNSQLGLTATSKKSDGEEEDVVTETVDANAALRQEVLSFATAGIRSSARAGAKATPDRRAITRRPQQHNNADSEAFERLINPMFFVRFILGYTDDLRALEDLVANKRRSVNETFMRQTVTMAPPRVRGTNGGTSSTATSIDVPLSQRPTVVSGASVTMSVHVRVDGSQRQSTDDASAPPRTDCFPISTAPYLHTGTDGSNRPSFRPSFLPSAFSYFSRGSALDHHLSNLDRHLQGDNQDPEGGMELAGRRSSSMVETDKEIEAAQSTELFDLGTRRLVPGGCDSCAGKLNEITSVTLASKEHVEPVPCLSTMIDAVISRCGRIGQSILTSAAVANSLIQRPRRRGSGGIYTTSSWTPGKRPFLFCPVHALCCRYAGGAWLGKRWIGLGCLLPLLPCVHGACGSSRW